MRVIGGTLRGRQLATFTGRDIRPTPDRVREALFSILYSRFGTLDGRRVLDLFAGSGALGIEAISRGALSARFVEMSSRAAAVLKDNLSRLRIEERTEVTVADLWQVIPALAAGGAYAVIFADPPYAAGHGPRLLAEIDRHRLLDKNGLLCLETAAGEALPETSGALRQVESRRYGSTAVHLYRCEAGGKS